MHKERNFKNSYKNVHVIYFFFQLSPEPLSKHCADIRFQHEKRRLIFEFTF